MMTALIPVMQQEEFRLIREFVAEVYGLIIDEGKMIYLSSRLLPRLNELRLQSFRDYYAFLKFSPPNSDEHQKFVSLLTNNETYFFREDAQLRVIAEHLLPQLKERKQSSGQRKIRIYSAGCSSGEEVYTIAMILLESGHFIWDWDVMVTGIDIDRAVLDKAREGVYTGRAFQSTSPHYMEKYFTRSGENFQVKESLRRITRFVEGNLLQLDPFSAHDRADVIFCRNVFIYFNDDTIRKIVDSFTSLLHPEGYLFLGHSESLSRITSRYEPVRHSGAIIYRQREKS